MMASFGADPPVATAQIPLRMVIFASDQLAADSNEPME